MFGKVAGGLGILGIMYGLICGLLVSAPIGVGMISVGLVAGLIGMFFIED